jgi:hypothetical protein
MRPVVKIVSALAAVALLAMGGAVSAAPISWDTSGACAVGYTCNSSEMSFLGSDGVTVVTAKAFSREKISGATIGSTFLGKYSGGLGVTSYSGDSHTVDNGVYNDFVAFFFSETVEMNAVEVTTYGDTDMSVWMGDVVGGVPTFAGEDFADLDFNYGGHFDDYGGNVDRTVDFGLDAEFGNLLVVAALVPGNGVTDLFKIKTLYAESVATEPDDPPSTVAGPSSLLVFGPAVFGLAMMRRRRAQRAVDDAADTSDENEEAAA